MTLIVDGLELGEDASVLGGLEQFEPDGASPEDATPGAACSPDDESPWVMWEAAAAESEWALVELTALTVAV
jgi:hypothetical protein